jgi:glycosyltransferase involved in cell wall biosynthesis
VEHGRTGLLVPPGKPDLLAEAIANCHNQPRLAATIARQARDTASQRFHLNTINQQISQLLERTVRVKN